MAGTNDTRNISRFIVVRREDMRVYRRRYMLQMLLV